MRAAEVALTEKQRATLRSWLAAGKTERRQAFRAQVILALAEGLGNAALADRGDLLGRVLDPRAICSLLGRIARIEALEVAVTLGIGQFDELGWRGPREIAVLVVDRLDPRPIHCRRFPAEQIQPAAQQRKLPEHCAEGIAVVAVEVGDGLEVGPQVPRQPDRLDVAMGLGGG